ncbi:tripartite tricarboxylate transporter substrate binding protein [Ramlibacter sp.]|uniref:tripartite tricarboxylate transporter substrate binding protein n=1 Tax=Ramlibacter sp. TaxID=1917967 RepID=UPI003D10E61F
MNIRRFATLAAVAAAIGLGSAGAAAQGAFPNKPVKIMVGYPAGSGNDLIARAVGNRLSEIWKQPVVVENRAGASGQIGAEAVARAAPDGYTLLLTGSSHLIQAAVAGKGPYRAVEDFNPISLVGGGPLILEVNNGVAAKTVAEFVALGKKQTLAYGSAGTGTSPHIAGEMFARAAGIKMTHVPYKGSAPAQTDLIGGQVQAVFQVTQVALPHVRSGQVRALAVTGKTRLPDLPNVPTMTEAGFPDASLQIWWGFLAPAGTPADVMRVLTDSVRQAVATPDVQQRLAGAGLVPGSSTAEDMLSTMKSDFTTFVNLVKAADIKAD